MPSICTASRRYRAARLQLIAQDHDAALKMDAADERTYTCPGCGVIVTAHVDSDALHYHELCTDCYAGTICPGCGGDMPDADRAAGHKLCASCGVRPLSPRVTSDVPHGPCAVDFSSPAVRAAAAAAQAANNGCPWL